MTQKTGHTMSPSQKIRDSALDAVFSLGVCKETETRFHFTLFNNNQRTKICLKCFESDDPTVPYDISQRGQWCCSMLHYLQLCNKVMLLHYTVKENIILLNWHLKNGVRCTLNSVLLLISLVLLRSLLLSRELPRIMFNSKKET